MEVGTKDYQENLKKITDKIAGLPTLPTVVNRITQLLQNPRTSAEEIGQAITNDQSLASKVLKLVNSAFYGFSGKINTITHAIVILGFSTVKNIVLTASIFDVFGKSKDTEFFNVEQFWMHSIGTGTIAKVIAQHIGHRAMEETFIAGLIHDLGKLILFQYARDDFKKVIDYTQKEKTHIYVAEKKVLGVTHETIGSWLAEKWNLPKDLSECVSCHHFPSTAKNSVVMTSIVHVSDILCRALDYGNGGDDRVNAIHQEAWDRLKLDFKTLEKILPIIDQEMEKTNIFFQIM